MVAFGAAAGFKTEGNRRETWRGLAVAGGSTSGGAGMRSSVPGPVAAGIRGRDGCVLRLRKCARCPIAAGRLLNCYMVLPAKALAGRS